MQVKSVEYGFVTFLPAAQSLLLFCITHADISILFDLRLFKVTVESPISGELCMIKNVRSDQEVIILKPDPINAKALFSHNLGPEYVIFYFFYLFLFIA